MTVPVTISGQRQTASGASPSLAIQQEQRVVDMADIIYLLDPEAAPLTLFSSMASRKTIGNPEFKALEDELIPALDVLNGAIADGVDVTLVVTNGDWWHAGDVWRNQQTSEVVRVTSVDYGTDIATVVRGVGSTAAAAMGDGDTMYRMGTANDEGDVSKASRTTVKAVEVNFAQIFRHPFAMSGTLMASELYGGDDLPFQQKKGGIEQATGVERAFFFGEAAENLDATGTSRYTGGIDEFIISNDFDLITTFDITTFYAQAAKLFRHGRKDKVYFASRSIVAEISNNATTFLEVMPKEQTLGMDIKKLNTPHGTLRIMNHDLLEGPVYGANAYAVDLDNVGYRHMEGRDNKLHMNIQENDRDGRKDEYLGEIGCFRVLEETHGRWFNGPTAIF